jgi:Pyridine nucleotide-disulphide oxidoreductase
MSPSIEVLPIRDVIFGDSKKNHHYSSPSYLAPSVKTFEDSPPAPVPKPEVDQAKTFSDTPFVRTSAYPIEKLPGGLPHANVDVDVEPSVVTETILKDLNTFNPVIFTRDSVWRDVYSLTGSTRTFYGVDDIHTVWTELEKIHHQSEFKLMPNSSKVVRMSPEHSWVQARFSFETNGELAMRCSGQIGIVPKEGGWKVWFLTTILEELKGIANPDTMTPEAMNAYTNDPAAFDFECVVVGAGYAGLCLGGRLKALGVKYVMLEKNDNVGDNWTKRYDSARFHTSKDYSDMPLSRIFTSEFPYFPSGKDLARGYKQYVEKYELNIWLSTTLENATYDEDKRIWTLRIRRGGNYEIIKSPHFVLAIGAGGSIPVMPDLPGKEKFQGTVIHSATYMNAKEWKGKKGVVIGSGNTAHDVAEDMLNAGCASTTMIQRGRTSVFPIEHYRKWSDPLYNPDYSIEEADRQVMAMPITVTRAASLHGTKTLAALEPERFDSLERAGFRVERYGDLWKLLSDRLGGHYMDVGTSRKISDGLVCIPHANLPISRLIKTDQSEGRRCLDGFHRYWSSVQ